MRSILDCRSHPLRTIDEVGPLPGCSHQPQRTLANLVDGGLVAGKKQRHSQLRGLLVADPVGSSQP
jgi:hypothetical protein